MIEVSDWLWETLAVLKDVYDFNPEASVLQSYRDNVLDGEDVFEVSLNSLGEFFEDTRCYYNDKKELDITVIFDPIITAFWKLCDEYEAYKDIDPKENKHREEMDKALDSAFYIPDYSFDAIWYSDTKHKNGCRIVLIMYCEFYTHYMVPGALAEAHAAFEYHTKRLQKELDELKQGEIVAFPSEEEKEAA